jgi:hypothetical protein
MNAPLSVAFAFSPILSCPMAQKDLERKLRSLTPRRPRMNTLVVSAQLGPAPIPICQCQLLVPGLFRMAMLVFRAVLARPCASAWEGAIP